jgi:hypothetical protein
MTASERDKQSELLCFCNKRERERENTRESKSILHFFSFAGVLLSFSAFSFLHTPPPSLDSSFIYHQQNSKHHTHLRTMSDHEVETFESTDAGASQTVPMQAGSVRKGGYIVIKGKACKVRASPPFFFAFVRRKMKRIRARPSSRERNVGRFTRVLNALQYVLLFSSFCGGV